MKQPYFVRFHSARELSVRQKITIELLFAKELERGLGGAHAVVMAHRAWRDACDAAELSPQTASLAVKWPSAFDTAQRVFLNEAGERGSYFEFHLTPQNAGAC